MIKAFNYPDRVETLLARCESPIESIMLNALLHADGIKTYPILEGKLEDFRNKVFGRDVMTIGSQVRILGFRADILVSAQYRHSRVTMAVECDGEGFHDDKEKDAKRDEAFRRQGVEVIRFTGSDIFNGPERCVRVVVDRLHDKSKSWESKQAARNTIDDPRVRRALLRGAVENHPWLRTLATGSPCPELVYALSDEDLSDPVTITYKTRTGRVGYDIIGGGL